MNAEIPFRFGRAQQLTLGADVNISAAAEESEQPPSPNVSAISARRNDYGAYLGYSVTLTVRFSSTRLVASSCGSIGREIGPT